MQPYVLVVDDEPCVTDGLRRNLQKAPYHVVTAHSGPAALEILSQQPVDILISDEKMPYMSGTELMTRSSVEYPDTLRVLLTGHATFESAIRAINDGQIHYFLTKPCNSVELLRTLGTAWERREQEKTRLLATWVQASDKVASSELQTTRQESVLEQLRSPKQEFFGLLSHELRTPLTAIMGYNDLLTAGQFGPVTIEQYHTLYKIGTSTHHLLGVVNTMLDIGHVEAGLSTLHCETLNLSEMMRTIENEVRHVWEKGLTFSWQVVPNTPCLHTDPAKLKTIIKNLISNAIKFTERGHVMVNIASRDNGIEIQVTDTGIGIEEDFLPLIFEPFHQGESIMTRRYGGLGLGLYQVNRLLQMVGGTISVESTVGHGSTFRVWLPATALIEEKVSNR